MTRTDFINSVMAKMNGSKADAEKAVTSVIGALQDALVDGESIQFIGFGTFEISERAARTGRNPQTGAEIQIPASKSVHFKNGKKLKEILNGGDSH